MICCTFQKNLRVLRKWKAWRTGTGKRRKKHRRRSTARMFKWAKLEQQILRMSQLRQNNCQSRSLNKTKQRRERPHIPHHSPQIGEDLRSHKLPHLQSLLRSTKTRKCTKPSHTTNP